MSPGPMNNHDVSASALKPRGVKARLLLFLLGVARLRYAPLAALFGMLLALPSVFTGLRTEDHYHFSAIAGGAIKPPWRLNLFNYIDGNVGSIYGLKDFGTVPWFTLQDYKVSFWRPLTSFTHWVDYHYFPNSPWVAHCQSLLWYGLLILAVSLVYRRMLGLRWVAALATLLYAVDDAHAHPVGWLANRNALLTTLFGVLALWAHDVWRRPLAEVAGGTEGAAVSSASDTSRKRTRTLAGIAAPLLLCLGLLAGEFAVGAVGYIAAHALCLDSGVLQRVGIKRFGMRVLVLAPSVVVVGVWLYYYRTLGYGTYGTDFHLDPVRDAGRFALELPWRLPALVVAQLFGVDAESWWRLSPGSVAAFAALAILAILAFLRWLLPSLKQASTRFWLWGMLLSSLPACAALPQDRLLFFTGIGGFALVAIAVRQYVYGPLVQADTLEQAAHLVLPRATRWSAAVALGLLLVHGVIAPMTFPQRSLIMHRFDSELDQVGEALMQSHPDHQEHLVLFGGPSYFYVASVLGLRATQGQHVPRHIRMLHAGRGPLKVTRVSQQQLLLDAPHGFYSDPFDGTYRGHQYPMRVGEGLQLSGMLIIVKQVGPNGVPSQIEVNFQREIVRGNYHFVAWRRGQRGAAGYFTGFSLPALGQSVELPSGY